MLAKTFPQWETRMILSLAPSGLIAHLGPSLRSCILFSVSYWDPFQLIWQFAVQQSSSGGSCWILDGLVKFHFNWLLWYKWFMILRWWWGSVWIDLSAWPRLQQNKQGALPSRSAPSDQTAAPLSPAAELKAWIQKAEWGRKVGDLDRGHPMVVLGCVPVGPLTDQSIKYSLDKS